MMQIKLERKACSEQILQIITNCLTLLSMNIGRHTGILSWYEPVLPSINHFLKIKGKFVLSALISSSATFPLTFQFLFVRGNLFSLCRQSLLFSTYKSQHLYI